MWCRDNLQCHHFNTFHSNQELRPIQSFKRLPLFNVWSYAIKTNGFEVTTSHHVFTKFHPNSLRVQIAKMLHPPQKLNRSPFWNDRGYLHRHHLHTKFKLLQCVQQVQKLYTLQKFKRSPLWNDWSCGIKMWRHGHLQSHRLPDKYEYNENPPIGSKVTGAGDLTIQLRLFKLLTCHYSLINIKIGHNLLHKTWNERGFVYKMMQSSSTIAKDVV